MTDEPLYPLRFEPLLKRLIWGGRRLGTILGKPLGPESDYAESWEVSDHRDDVSRVADGSLAGTSLRTLLRERRLDLMGTALSDRTQFPLLVKFLDAHQVLSVQVHPDDEAGARLVGDNGKTEAWVILHADPGSVIYAGLRPGVQRHTFEKALAAGTVEPLLHAFEPRAGDCVFIPAGTVHAIGAGIVLAEIQQMSDATFRVFDWNRIGPDGQPRALHVRQALDAIDFRAGPVDPVRAGPDPATGGQREGLVDCPYFTLDRWALKERVMIGSRERFTLLLGLAGRATLHHEARDYELTPGTTYLLPASIGPCSLAPAPAATLLACQVP